MAHVHSLAAGCKAPSLMTAMLATYNQYHGTTHGLYLDADNVTALPPLVNTEGMPIN
jgi:hypothetical protein